MSRHQSLEAVVKLAQDIREHINTHSCKTTGDLEPFEPSDVLMLCVEHLAVEEELDLTNKMLDLACTLLQNKVDPPLDIFADSVTEMFKWDSTRWRKWLEENAPVFAEGQAGKGGLS